MFRKTSAQTSLLENQFLLPPEKRARLERSWARGFRERVLPLIDEELFRGCFDDRRGRPNKSIRLLVGLHIIKEMGDYTDAEVIDALEFNLQVQYALGVEARTAHVCQKTLHNHRKLLMEEDRAQQMFERITRGLAEVDGLSLGRQRLDSTHVMSHIAVLTRLGLFVQTITSLLKELRRSLPEKLDQVDAQYARRYLEREGYFADAKRGQARRRLRSVASDLYRLVRAFDADEEVVALASYQTLVRLFEEQCELVESAGTGPQPVAVPKPDAREVSGAEEEEGSALAEEDAPIGAGDARPSASEDEEEEVRVRLREGREISSSSLQSPHDPDATYGRKGKGYEAQIAETCDAKNPYQVITGVALNGANESDQGAVLGMVEQLSGAGLGPEELVADTGYGSGENIVACAELGVDLQAPVQDPDALAKQDRMAEPVQPTVLIEDAEELAAPAPEARSLSADERALAADEPALGLEDFVYDETYSEVQRCPAGEVPVEQVADKAGRTVWSRFSAESCASCPLAARCPARPRKDGGRTLRFRRSMAATACRQQEQRGSAFKERYKIRSGIEATNAELKGRHGAAALRVRGRDRVTLAMTMKALAVNAKRASEHHAAARVDGGLPPPRPDEERPAIASVSARSSQAGADARSCDAARSARPPPPGLAHSAPPSPGGTTTAPPRPPGRLRTLGRRLARALGRCSHAEPAAVPAGA